MELMAVSLAACTAMDVISIRKMATVTAFQVRAGERAEEHPKVPNIHLEHGHRPQCG
jgi:uncharacterized OsmC-like protein